MDKIIGFIKTRKLWYWFVLAATVFGVVGLGVYLAAGRTQFDPNFAAETIVTMALGIVLGIFSLIKSYRVALFAQYLCFLFAFLSYVTSQMNLIGNLIYNVDGSTFPTAFFLLVAFSALSTALSLAAAIIKKGKKNGVAAGATEERQ